MEVRRTGWTARFAAVVALAATLASLAAPAFAACRCQPCRSTVAHAAATCSHCAAPASSSSGERMCGGSCCSARAVAETPAVNPAATELDRPAPALAVACSPSTSGVAPDPWASAAAAFRDVSPTFASPPPHLSSLLRL